MQLFHYENWHIFTPFNFRRYAFTACLPSIPKDVKFGGAGCRVVACPKVENRENGKRGKTTMTQKCVLEPPKRSKRLSKESSRTTLRPPLFKVPHGRPRIASICALRQQYYLLFRELEAPLRTIPPPCNCFMDCHSGLPSCDGLVEWLHVNASTIARLQPPIFVQSPHGLTLCISFRRISLCIAFTQSPLCMFLSWIHFME